MKIPHLRYLILALLSVVMSACDKDRLVMPYGMTATINDTPFLATTFYAHKYINYSHGAIIDSSIIIHGSLDTGIGLGISTTAKLSTGMLYSIGGGASGYYITNSQYYYYGDGTFRITKISNTNIQGTFSFKVNSLGINVTDGAFNIDIR